MNTLIKSIKSVLLFSLMLTAIIFNKEISDSIINSISVCMNTLIPSLYAFMILADYLIKSNAMTIITKPLYLLLHRIIKLNEKEFSVFIISQVGGYPVGTKLITGEISQNKNYHEISENLYCICYASGPSFIFSIVADIIYNSYEAGIIIFISSILANLLLAVFLTRKRKIYHHTSKYISNYENASLSDSIFSSAKALYSVCLCMIVFNSAIAVSEFILPSDFLIKSIIEITNIKYFDSSTPLYISAFIISFGGLCVIFQCYVISGKRLKIIRFIVFRFITALLSSIICFFICKATGYEEIRAVGHQFTPHNININNPLTTVCVFIMSCILLYESENISIFLKKFLKKGRFI